LTSSHIFKMQGMPLTHRGSDTKELEAIVSRVMHILNQNLPVEMLSTTGKIAPEKLAMFEKQRKL